MSLMTRNAAPPERVASPVDVRARIDLEALVTWAIRDQKADRDDVALFDVEADVHNLLLSDQTYRGQAIDLCRPAADGCATIARKAAVGCEIDGSGVLRGVSPRLHPDAEAVMDAIRRLSGREAALVLQHARMGDRPDWSTGEKRLVPVPVAEERRGAVRHKIGGAWERVPARSEVARAMMRRGVSIVDRHGRPTIAQAERGFHYRPLEDGSREVFVRWCPVEEQPSDAWVAFVNGMYAAWHAGMMALLGVLLGARLRDHVLTGFLAPARPWCSIGD